ncbi:unnamed protein product, partial [Bubo scandiacus]
LSQVVFACVAEVPQGVSHYSQALLWSSERREKRDGALGAYRKVGCFQAPVERRIQICSCRAVGLGRKIQQSSTSFYGWAVTKGCEKTTSASLHQLSRVLRIWLPSKPE